MWWAGTAGVGEAEKGEAAEAEGEGRGAAGRLGDGSEAWELGDLDIRARGEADPPRLQGGLSLWWQRHNFHHFNYCVIKKVLPDEQPKTIKMSFSKTSTTELNIKAMINLDI